jgi:hypothetical protein
MNFPYIHWWKILNDQPKWIERHKHMNIPKLAAKKQKTSANTSLTSSPLAITIADGVKTPQGAHERSAGKKKEKHILHQCASMEVMEYLVAKKREADAEKELKKEERCKRAFALQEERIRIEIEMTKLKRQLEEKRNMNIDMSTLSYYERRNDEIMAKCMNMYPWSVCYLCDGQFLVSLLFV